MITLILAVTWGLRLSIFLTYRNWGLAEDYRYQKIRKDCGGKIFWLTSLPVVFGLQAVLAWVISFPLCCAIVMPNKGFGLEYAGYVFWLVGFLFEAIGDAQLAAFKADPASKG